MSVTTDIPTDVAADVATEAVVPTSNSAATDVPIHTTTSLCVVCKHATPANVVEREGGVWMTKTCSEHGYQEVMLSNNAIWYRRTRAIELRLQPPRKAVKEIDEGCPFDCGTCTAHEARVRLPVVTITSACNLNCPICYVHNKNSEPYNMTTEDFAKILEHLAEVHGDDGIDIVNFTGGEPTMHPDFLTFLEMAKDAGVHRVSICTNGIKLAKDESLVERLAELGGRVALSFDSFEEDADFLMQGAHLLKIKKRGHGPSREARCRLHADSCDDSRGQRPRNR